LTAYGVQLGKDIIDGMSEYYAFNYADSFLANRAKSDQFGIPDFSAGAMENWGLVTYQNYLVYMIPEESYEQQVVSTASVFAHELQHQWTGNLITCTWWDELWINEAFADYGGYLGLIWAEPTWNWKNEFIQNEWFAGNL
jgi:aminopeptidase N